MFPISIIFFFFFFFFFNDTATTEIYTLSLHDALPTSPSVRLPESWPSASRSSFRRSRTRALAFGSRCRLAMSPTMRWASGPQARAPRASESASRAQRTRELSKRSRRPSLRLKADVAHELAVLGIVAADELAEIFGRFGDDDQAAGDQLFAHLRQLDRAIDLLVELHHDLARRPGRGDVAEPAAGFVSGNVLRRRWDP